jgi:alpha-N-arabinofuranosidase
VDLVSAAATHDDETGETAVFLVNRSPTDPVPVELALRDLTCSRVEEAHVVTDADQAAVNSAARPDRVRARPAQGWSVEDQVVRGGLPACSWTMLRLR